MPIVTLLGNTIKTIDLPHNAPLTELDNLLVFGCRAAACGACAIEVVFGTNHLSPVSPDEKKLLDDIGLPAGIYRLGCQCKVLGDVTLKQC